jgi:hypothetical protein
MPSGFAQRPSSSGVEQRIENPRVGGSNPPSGTIFSKKIDVVLVAKPPARSITLQRH